MKLLRFSFAPFSPRRWWKLISHSEENCWKIRFSSFIVHCSFLPFHLHHHHRRQKSLLTTKSNKKRTIDFRTRPKEKLNFHMSTFLWRIFLLRLARCLCERWRLKITHLTLMSLTPKRLRTLFCQSVSWMMSQNISPQLFPSPARPTAHKLEPFSHAKLTKFVLKRTRLLFNWICPQIYFEMVI